MNSNSQAQINEREARAGRAWKAEAERLQGELEKTKRVRNSAERARVKAEAEQRHDHECWADTNITVGLQQDEIDRLKGQLTEAQAQIDEHEDRESASGEMIDSLVVELEGIKLALQQMTEHRDTAQKAMSYASNQAHLEWTRAEAAEARVKSRRKHHQDIIGATLSLMDWFKKHGGTPDEFMDVWALVVVDPEPLTRAEIQRAHELVAEGKLPGAALSTPTETPHVTD